MSITANISAIGNKAYNAVEATSWGVSTILRASVSNLSKVVKFALGVLAGANLYARNAGKELGPNLAKLGNDLYFADKFFDFINVENIKFWFEVDKAGNFKFYKKSTYEIVSRIFSTFVDFTKKLRFLDSHHLINLTGIAGKLSKVPLIGRVALLNLTTLSNGADLLANGISLTENINNFVKIKAEAGDFEKQAHTEGMRVVMLSIAIDASKIALKVLAAYTASYGYVAVGTFLGVSSIAKTLYIASIQEAQAQQNQIWAARAKSPSLAGDFTN